MPKKGFQWRYYQLEAIAAALRFYLEGKRRTVIQLPTGAGKTVTAAGLIEELLRRYPQQIQHVLFVVPKMDLVHQTYQSFLKSFFTEEEVGRIQGDYNELGRKITIACKDTIDGEYRLQQYLDSIGGQVDLLFIDEAQYSLTDLYFMIIDRCLSPDGFLVGLSATPIRSDGQSLAKLYKDRLCYSIDIFRLIREGYLSDIRYIKVNVAGEQEAAEQAVPATTPNRDKVVKLIRNHIHLTKAYDAWYPISRTRRTLVAASNLPMAREYEQFFAQKGVIGVTISDKTKDRDTFYDKFAKKEIQLLSNYNVLAVGSDIPEIETIFLDRDTDSIGLIMQIVGRGLRLAPGIGKTYCLLIDMTAKKHDFLDFVDLFGSEIEDPTVSLRDVLISLHEKQEREDAQMKEEQQGVTLSTPDIGVTFDQVTAYEQDVFLGDGWVTDPDLGDVRRVWNYKENQQHFLVAECAFTGGGYQAVHIYHQNRRTVRTVINKKLLTRMEAMRACHQYAILKERRLTGTQQKNAPQHWNEPISAEHFQYLRDRKVPMYPPGYVKTKSARKPMTEEQYEQVRAKMTERDYQMIAGHLKRYGSWSGMVKGRGFGHGGGGAVTFYADHGPHFSNPVSKNIAEKDLADRMAQAEGISITLTPSQGKG